MHLTNNALQARDPSYKQRKEETIARWTQLEAEIGMEKAQQLRKDIKALLLVVVAAAKRKLMRKKGTYELLGCDILVDENCRPYLLEVNTNPAMFTPTTVQKEIWPPLIGNTLDIALQLYREQSTKGILPSLPHRNFELLYDEESQFVLGSPKGATEFNGLPCGPTEDTFQEKSFN